MKKILEFVSRYVKSIFDLQLFKLYFKESKLKAVLFIMPFVLIFTMVSYYSMIETSESLEESYNTFYDQVKTITYSEALDFVKVEDEDEDEDEDEEKEEKSINENYPELQAEDAINFTYDASGLKLQQDKVLSKEFDVGKLEYNLTIDTNNEFGIEKKASSEYTTEEKNKMKSYLNGVSIYANSDVVIVLSNDQIKVNDITNIDELSLNNNQEIFDYIVGHKFSTTQYLIASFVSILFMIVFCTVLLYFTISTTAKKREVIITKDRLFKITIYSLPIGIYIFSALTLFVTLTNVNLSFIIPILTMSAMVYTGIKTLTNVQEYLRIEERVEKRNAKKAKKALKSKKA